MQWCVLATSAKRFALEALDDPDLPERLRAVELLRDDAGGEALQLPFVAGARQARVPHVVVDVEVLVVDPDEAIPERDGREALAIARDQVQARGDVGADGVDVDAAVRTARRARRRAEHGGDVLVGGRAFDGEEGVVDDGEAVVGIARHARGSGRRRFGGSAVAAV